MSKQSVVDKKEKATIKTKFKLFFVLVGIISAIGLLALYVSSLLSYMVSPTLYSFKNSTGGVLLENFFLFALVFLLVFSKDIKMPKIGKVLALVYAVLNFAIGIFQLGRIEYSFLYIYGITNIIVTLVMLKKVGKCCFWICPWGILAIVEVVRLSLSATSFGDETGVWIFVLSITIIALVVAIIYCSKNKAKLNAKAKSKSVDIILLTLVCSFMFSFLAIDSTNVCFDYSEPTHLQTRIVEKEIWSGGGHKSRTKTYYLIVEIDGEKTKIRTSKARYNMVKEGEVIVLSIYDGAFGNGYYMYELDLQSQKRS